MVNRLDVLLGFLPINSSSCIFSDFNKPVNLIAIPGSFLSSWTLFPDDYIILDMYRLFKDFVTNICIYFDVYVYLFIYIIVATK